MEKIIVIRQAIPCNSEFEYDCWTAGQDAIKTSTGLVATRYCEKEKQAFAYYKDCPGELQKGQKRGWLTLH